MRGLKDIVCRLREHEVDFVLAGGFGVVAQGSSLVTRDVDVACRMDADNLTRIHDAFADCIPSIA